MGEKLSLRPKILMKAFNYLLVGTETPLTLSNDNFKNFNLF
jgi:hypothetical protein